MNKNITQLNKAETQTQSKIKQQTTDLRFKEISNSIFQLENSLEKYLESKDEIEIETVYWHIGTIRAASKS